MNRNQHVYKKIAVSLCLLLTSIALCLIASEKILELLGFKPLIQTVSNAQASRTLNREGVPPEAFKATSMDEFRQMGFIKGIYGNKKLDPDVGYTYYDEPHGFVDGKTFYNNWSAYKRVLVLGDSFTAGCCAPAGKGFVALLDRHFKDRKIAFFNTGVGGYGQNNELAVLRKYYKLLKPNIVLLGFYTGNDFADNVVPMDRLTSFPGYGIANYEYVLTKEGVSIRRRSQEEIWNLYQ